MSTVIVEVNRATGVVTAWAYIGRRWWCHSKKLRHCTEAAIAEAKLSVASKLRTRIELTASKYPA